MEKSLIVSAPLVVQIGQRLKTVTRRLNGLEEINQRPNDWTLQGPCDYDQFSRFRATFGGFIDKKLTVRDVFSPYGGPDAKLWVRENWFVSAAYDLIKPIVLANFDYDIRRGYMADGPKPDWAGRTRPAIHLPRKFARYVLNIEHLGVERLHDITEEEAVAEGVATQTFNGETSYYHYLKDKWGPSPVHSFETLWKKLNGPDAWELNPWVWVISFNLLND